MLELITILSLVANAVAVTVIAVDRQTRSALTFQLKAREEELAEALKKIAETHNEMHSHWTDLRGKVGELTTKMSSVQTQLNSGVRR